MISLHTSVEPRPVLLIDVSRVLRSYGTIWSIAKTEYGTLFRVSLTGQQVRVLSQLPGSPAPNFLPDSLAPLHVVENISTLTSWLASFGTRSGGETVTRLHASPPNS